MNARILSCALATGLIGAWLVAPTVQAVPLDQFDAPLLGTTATQQLTRMPSLEQVRCSDAACTTGLFQDTALSLVEYSTKTIMPDAGYTRVPEFVRGVNSVWRDLTVRQGDTSFANFTIAEYQQGSDMKAVMQSIAELTKTALTETLVDGTPVFTGQVVNESKDENDFSGTSFKSAYVLGENSLVRAGCQAGESGVETSTCTVANLIPLAMYMAKAQPGSSIPKSAQLEKLAPTMLPAALTPLAVYSAGGDHPWVIDVTNKKLLASLNDKPTAFAQYTLKDSPRMYIMSLSTRLDRPAQASGFLKKDCDSSDDQYPCTKTGLSGRTGAVTIFRDRSADGAVTQVTVEGLNKNTLMSFTCFKRQAVSGYMTKAEVAKCTSLAKALLG